METKKYNNKEACRRYYEKNKNSPEFMQRKAMNTKRSYFKKHHPVFSEVFQEWKKLTVGLQSNAQGKPIRTSVRRKAYNFMKRIDKLLLKSMIDIWKEYKVKQVKPAYNPNYKPIVCSFF